MFFYPDPEPIGHCITDVSPSYLTDGVFFSGRSIGPTHKCVAKQLSAIPRQPNDPVAPEVKLNPKTLENWTVNSKAWYVDNCGRNAKALYGMMGLLPKEEIDAYAGWKSKVAIFPRSEQYEYSYIKQMRIKDSENLQMRQQIHGEETKRSLERTRMDPHEKARQRQEKIPNCINQSAGVRGLPNDREFRRPDPPADVENALIRKKQSFPDPPRAYDEPGVICGREVSFGSDSSNQNYQDKNELLMPMPIMQEENRGPRYKNEGENLKDDAANCKCLQYAPYESSSIPKTEDDNHEDDAEGDDDAKKKSGMYPLQHEAEYDPRWHLLHGVCDVPRNDVDRKSAMLNLHRPYNHEINTWYSRNKPTELVPTVLYEGKRPILEWHFSNL